MAADVLATQGARSPHVKGFKRKIDYVDDSVQDCDISTTLPLEISQSCTKQLMS